MPLRAQGMRPCSERVSWALLLSEQEVANGTSYKG